MFVRAEFLAGAWWQLLTAQWVHLNWAHGLANAAALALMVVVLGRLLAPRWLLSAGVGGQLGVAAVLALDTSCSWYAGTSGALHGLWAGAAWALSRGASLEAPRPALPVLGWAMLLALILKLLVQRLAGDASAVSWLGLPVYLPAHEAGALGGWVLVALTLWAAQHQRHPA